MIRIQFEVSEDRVKEIENLMADTDISTKKELLNNALTLFQWAVKEAQQGNSIASVDEKSKIYRELAMPALTAAGAKNAR